MEALVHVDSLLPPYKLVDRSAEEPLLPYCQSHGIGAVIDSPLMSGLRSGQIHENSQWAATDWR
jgi:aryl-alcohol dehydrogenase-like predicted oxidoreductase